MPKKQSSKNQNARSADADMVGIIRSQIEDPRHIAYSTKNPADAHHLMPRTRKQMGFDPFPAHKG